MYKEKLNLDGKVAIVTGASRGIGEATATAFAEAGAKLILVGRKLDTLEEVAHRIFKAGGEATPVSAHVGKTPDLDDLVTRTIARYGGLDILVNNAATNPHFGDTIDCSDEAWDKIFQVNVASVFYLSKKCVPHMEKRPNGGVIVNNASYGGITPIPGIGAYCVSKAAVIMLTKVLAVELAAKKIRVNAVAPGVVKTKFSEALWKDEFKMAEIEKNVPMSRPGVPEEIASAILYLASDASSYATGAVLVVDGGTSV